MKGKKRSVTQFQTESVRHISLSKELIERIKGFKEILAEVEDTPLKETIEDFKTDENPEIEVALWERITRVYQKYISENSVIDLAARKEVFAVIVGTAAGSGLESFRNLKLLDEGQIKAIIVLY